MKHHELPKHCSVCGVDWPAGHHGLCRSCGAGLPCRADTTDTVAPDPPCRGSRVREAASDPDKIVLGPLTLEWFTDPDDSGIGGISIILVAPGYEPPNACWAQFPSDTSTGIVPETWEAIKKAVAK